MKCKAERPWLPFANLWGPFSLPPPMASFFYQSVFLATWRLSSPVSQPRCLQPLILPLSLSLWKIMICFFFFFPCKSWTLHFANVQLEGFNPRRLFLFPGKLQWWLSICSFACALLCLCACRSIYVPSRSLTLALRPLEVTSLYLQFTSAAVL